MTEIKLEIRKEYMVELYPSDSRVTALYVGQTGKEHNFVYEDGEEMGTIAMDDHWIREIVENGKRILTYSPFSSTSVRKISTDKIRGSSVLSKLMFGGMLRE